MVKSGGHYHQEKIKHHLFRYAKNNILCSLLLAFFSSCSAAALRSCKSRETRISSVRKAIKPARKRLKADNRGNPMFLHEFCCHTHILHRKFGIFANRLNFAANQIHETGNLNNKNAQGNENENRGHGEKNPR